MREREREKKMLSLEHERLNGFLLVAIYFTRKRRSYLSRWDFSSMRKCVSSIYADVCVCLCTVERDVAMREFMD